MSLSGKVALVTGGSRGIGRAICIRLAELGAHVLVNYASRPDAAEETVAKIEGNAGQAFAVKFDVADVSEVQQSIKQLIADHERIDILVNNAGITRDGLLATMKEDDWDRVMDVNLKGVFNCSKAAFRPMMKNRWGRIINITSVVGVTGNAGQSNYAASKAGIIGLTKSSAQEFASRGITVNCVAPGYIETEMTEGLSDTVKEKLMQGIPMAVLGEPRDVAGAVAFLSSEDARYITGQVIHVNGGLVMV